MSGPVMMPLAAVLGLAFFTSPTVPARADSGPGRSLDDQLLEDLDTDPLDADVERELFSPGSKPSGEKEPGPSAADADPIKRLQLELGTAAVAEEVNPLLDIARQMRQVEGLIGRSESGAKTQNLQDGIVTNLEELIQQARKRCKQCKASSGESKPVASRQPIKQPGKKPAPGKGSPKAKPASQSNAKPGTAELRRPDIEEMNALVKKIWGELPEAAREQMLQPMIEEFLPKYELLIEEYFKRLAEEQAGREP